MPKPPASTLVPIDQRDATLVDLVEASLEEAIVSGRIAEGTALAEADLALALGVSRSPVRDALKRLAHKGLAVARPRRGMVVGSLALAEINDFFHLREALEGLAARLAAERMTSEEIAELQRHLDAVGRDLAASGSRGYPSAQDDFHARILQGARSRQLEGTMEAIQARVRLLRRRSGSTPRRARMALAEHRAILAAIEARDPAAAEAGMRQHIRNARENLATAPAEGTTP
jgi:DNA-binding GntR family transcriptional regulator